MNTDQPSRYHHHTGEQVSCESACGRRVFRLLRVSQHYSVLAKRVSYVLYTTINNIPGRLDPCWCHTQLHEGKLVLGLHSRGARIRDNEKRRRRRLESFGTIARSARRGIFFYHLVSPPPSGGNWRDNERRFRSLAWCLKWVRWPKLARLFRRPPPLEKANGASGTRSISN